jgi:hypothetical protein
VPGVRMNGACFTPNWMLSIKRSGHSSRLRQTHTDGHTLDDNKSRSFHIIDLLKTETDMFFFRVLHTPSQLIPSLSFDTLSVDTLLADTNLLLVSVPGWYFHGGHSTSVLLQLPTPRSG